MRMRTMCKISFLFAKLPPNLEKIKKKAIRNNLLNIFKIFDMCICIEKHSNYDIYKQNLK